MAVLGELYRFVINDFLRFIGNGIYMVLLLAAICYIVRKEKDKKSFCVWLPVAVLIFFFNPISILLIYRFLWGTYWRILWLIPIVPVIAYAGTKLIMQRPKLMQKILVFIVSAVIIAVCGTNMYSGRNFQKKENYFKIPTAAIDVSQHIIKYAGTWYPTVIVPNELYCYIRQYTSEIRLLYGRDAEGYMGGVGSDIEEVYQQMSSTEPDCELIGRVAQEYEVNIVIFNSRFHNLPDADTMKEYGLYYGGPVGDYIFYVLKYD